MERTPLILALMGAILGIGLDLIAGRYAQQGHIWRHGGAKTLSPREGVAERRILKLMAALAGAGLALSAAQMARNAPHLALLLGAGGVLLLASLIDARAQLLPRLLNLTFAALGIGEALLLPMVHRQPETGVGLFDALLTTPVLIDRLLGGLIAFAALMLVKRLYARLRRREGLGLGDVWLFAALACWVGFPALPWLLCSAALSALIGTVLLAAVRGQLGTAVRYQRLAFGPWLAMTGWALICAQRL